MDAIRVSDLDAADPKMIRRHLNALFEQNQSLLQRLEAAEQSLRSASGTVGGLSEQERRLLRAIATGSTDSPVSSQTPVVPTVSTLPPVNSAVNGQLVRLDSTDILYIFDGDSLSWVDILSTPPPNMMTLDTPQTVTSAAVKTVQASWIFQVAQTIVNALDANLILLVQDTNNSGTAAAGVVRVAGDTAALSIIGHGTARTVARCGITLGGWVELFMTAGSGVLIDTAGATPIVLGTNNTERARIDATGLQITLGTLRFSPAASQIVPGATSLSLRNNANSADNVLITDAGAVTMRGLLTLNRAGQALLVSGAAAAGTKMIEVNPGSSVFSVDVEGDVIARNLATAAVTSDAANHTTTVTGTITENSTSGVSSTIIYQIQWGGSNVVEVTGDGDMHIIGDLDIDLTLNVDGAAVIDGDVTVGAQAVVIRTGTADPNGSVTGKRGDLYMRTGIDTNNFYVKQTGDGTNTGWVLK